MLLVHRALLAMSAVCLVSGCPTPNRQADAATDHAGDGGSQANVGGSSAAGAAGGGSNCPSNVVIPTLCRVCANGECGAPRCSGGAFTGFVCPGDAAGSGGAGGAGAAGSGGSPNPSEVCNLACVQGKHCELQQVQCVRAPCPPITTCVDDADAGSASMLHWYESCGAPVCQNGPGNFDDPSIPNCTTEREGQACSSAGKRCDGVFTCGATLICAEAAPVTCPKSLARLKQDINYLDDGERARIHAQITQLRLASYRYKAAPNVPQLGFMIDDAAPSVAVAGETVNLYGYLSMAVAAIQVQDQQIKALERQLAELRAEAQTDRSSSMCGP